MKNFIYFALILTVVLVSCSKEGESENSDPQLPPMSDPDDICTAMDDINFMSYCYENFDINKDGKVSLTEAKAVQSLKSCTIKDYYPFIELMRRKHATKVQIRQDG